MPFFTISGSDFVEMFVGVGASRVRDMFEQAKKNAPCIIFIDEIDAVGRHRGAGLGGGNDEREQTLNQLLVEMDGFEANEGIILIAATNRPDVLDPALLRPGRFDRQVVVPQPRHHRPREDPEGAYAQGAAGARRRSASVIARGTPGFSGADLANLVNEAALLAARRNKRLVTQHEFEDAKDKVMMGAERRSMVMTEEEKTLTAYHEGGHALVALHRAGVDPLHKATIIPRGRALGMVMQPARARQALLLRAAMLKARHRHRHAAAASPRSSIFGKENVTTGAAGDIKQATELARAHGHANGACATSSGRCATARTRRRCSSATPSRRRQNMSEETAPADRRGDPPHRRRGVRARAQDPDGEYRRPAHDRRGLLEYETLSGEEIKDLLKGKPPVREFAAEVTPRPGPASAVPSRRTRQASARARARYWRPQPAAVDLSALAHVNASNARPCAGHFVFGEPHTLRAKARA